VFDIFKRWYTHRFEIRESATALGGAVRQYTIDGREGYDSQSFMREVKSQVVDLLNRNRQNKVYLALKCVMEKRDMSTGEAVTAEPTFRSDVETIVDGTDVNEIYSVAVDKMMESMACFQMCGSNWQFRNVVKLDINIIAYSPLRGSSYIELPKELAVKKAIINLKNEDDQCFKWAVTRALNPVDKNAERIDKNLRERAEELKWDGIQFPASLKDIDKFENSNDLSVNVFGYEKVSEDEEEKAKNKKGYVYPLRISSKQCERVVDLLLISDDEKQHYCAIKSLSRLLSSQVSNTKWKRYFCKRCLNSYDCVDKLKRHQEYCNNYEAVKIDLPKPGSMLGFKNYNRSMRHPFVVYADFESFIKPIDTCQPDPSESYSKKYQHHVPSSFCYYIKCFDDEVYNPKLVMYTAQSEDDDVAQKFIDMLEEDIKQIYKEHLKFPKEMKYTKSDETCFQAAEKCHICGDELGEDRVRDHCHLTGKFRGAAHESCNVNYQIPKFIPAIFHNLSGYDSHLFIKKLKAKCEGISEKISCIAKSEENYITFSKKVLVDWFTKEIIKKDEDGKEVGRDKK